MEKQIEEMGHIICGLSNSCDNCVFDKERCHERLYAEQIYNTGYRKADEVVEEITKSILEGVETIQSDNSDALLGATFAIEIVVLPILEAYKKKYTESEKNE